MPLNIVSKVDGALDTTGKIFAEEVNKLVNVINKVESATGTRNAVAEELTLVTAVSDMTRMNVYKVDTGKLVRVTDVVGLGTDVKDNEIKVNDTILIYGDKTNKYPDTVAVGTTNYTVFVNGKPGSQFKVERPMIIPAIFATGNVLHCTAGGEPNQGYEYENVNTVTSATNTNITVSPAKMELIEIAYGAAPYTVNVTLPDSAISEGYVLTLVTSKSTTYNGNWVKVSFSSSNAADIIEDVIFDVNKALVKVVNVNKQWIVEV